MLYVHRVYDRLSYYDSIIVTMYNTYKLLQNSNRLTIQLYVIFKII